MGQVAQPWKHRPNWPGSMHGSGCHRGGILYIGINHTKATSQSQKLSALALVFFTINPPCHRSVLSNSCKPRAPSPSPSKQIMTHKDQNYPILKRSIWLSADPLRLQWRRHVSTTCGLGSMKSPKEHPYRLCGLSLLWVPEALEAPEVSESRCDDLLLVEPCSEEFFVISVRSVRINQLSLKVQIEAF